MKELHGTTTYYGSEKVHRAIYSGMFETFTDQDWLRLALAALDQCCDPNDDKMLWAIMTLERRLEEK